MIELPTLSLPESGNEEVFGIRAGEAQAVTEDCGGEQGAEEEVARETEPQSMAETGGESREQTKDPPPKKPSEGLL